MSSLHHSWEAVSDSRKRSDAARATVAPTARRSPAKTRE
jgi:hypothetical protein